jgi:prepilin-type N-terminal cleavage/methylation domain-containing protein
MNHNKKGFTLIELLVVISIIALLMAILMPALSKAREQAKNVICRSRVKDQFTSQFLYATDNEGKFAGHTDNSPEYFRSKGSPNSNIRKLMADTYIQNGNIFICPILKVFGSYFEDTESGRPQRGTSWGGGWDAPIKGDGYYESNPEHILTAYMWLANFRLNTGALNDEDCPRPSFTYLSGRKKVYAEPWPNKTDECTSFSPFIAHRISYTPGNFFRDLSHGGKFEYIDSSTFKSSDSQDTPVCYGDGSIVMRKKSEMQSGGRTGNIEYFF